ncbi:hypothetical protein [Streptomyces sp. CCM_MD2014]|uniref:hypothetical protein n=1 Tax=Streptomyces sp. CCM_MD2014 TaxID=1561022 RepID=UPI00052A2314|nr:hypothetical protein [Streptomyces sp. CCM_MD2014]AIV35602.1 hypothetical protein NI25_20610 [Streptomyces sp. CCM_MD2014]
MTVEQEYAPGGLVPPAPTAGRFNGPVVFVPLGYGPAVAARAARLALLHGVEEAEAYVNEAAASRPTPRGTDRRPPG